MAVKHLQKDNHFSSNVFASNWDTLIDSGIEPCNVNLSKRSFTSPKVQPSCLTKISWDVFR